MPSRPLETRVATDGRHERARNQGVRQGARGRARCHLVDQVLDRRALKPALRSRVLASGIDQLVSMAVRDALSEDLPAEARPLAA